MTELVVEVEVKDVIVLLVVDVCVKIEVLEVSDVELVIVVVPDVVRVVLRVLVLIVLVVEPVVESVCVVETVIEVVHVADVEVVERDDVSVAEIVDADVVSVDLLVVLVEVALDVKDDVVILVNVAEVVVCVIGTHSTRLQPVHLGNSRPAAQPWYSLHGLQPGRIAGQFSMGALDSVTVPTPVPEAWSTTSISLVRDPIDLSSSKMGGALSSPLKYQVMFSYLMQ